MSCTGTTGCTCGCCAGTDVQTPQMIDNRAGLPAVSYRTGNWSSFKQSMLARLSSSDYPALKGLTTRSDDDFTVALLDASAMVLDILTFYQERIANENYLRTAGQLRSQTELARLIGYRPAPGVSATAYLAFTLKSAPGQAVNLNDSPVIVPQGTRVQSVPPQGQQPQVFETSADVAAKPEWNALPVLASVPWVPKRGDLSVLATGTATQLKPGDLILIVGDERLNSPTSNAWDLRVVTKAQIDGANNRTLIQWADGLGPGETGPAQVNAKLYAFRAQGSLFGYNAVDPNMLSTTIQGQVKGQLNDQGGGYKPRLDWNFVNASRDPATVDLDSVYSKIAPGSWIALIVPDQLEKRSPAGVVSLFNALSVTSVGRSAFALSSKISRVRTDSHRESRLAWYYSQTRRTVAAVQTEQLGVEERPLTFPLYGIDLYLQDLRVDMASVQVVSISGPRQKLSVLASNKPALTFAPSDGSASRSLAEGELLTILDPTQLPLSQDGSIPTVNWVESNKTVTLSLQDASGRIGSVTTALKRFGLADASSKDPLVTECAIVSKVDSTSASTTLLQLSAPLANCYNRAASTVNANVVSATHGQSVSDLLGNGSASTQNQAFKLKQSPLTYVPAVSPTGRATTLQVVVNGIDWIEVPTLYGQGATARVYATLGASDGSTTVVFGDGAEGSLLPTGQNNVQANYRMGSGSVGNVGAGSLSTLMDRPLGVSGVTNPGAASGGQDPESPTSIQQNAPQTVLTLGRAVSIDDYRNFASTFASIGKAYAIWIPSGPGRGVFVTVAGVNGAVVGDDTISKLAASLQAYGDPLIPISIARYVESLFSFTAAIQYDQGVDPSAVDTSVMTTLDATFGFAARSFGQGVSVDEVAATIQGVSGVTAVNVTGLTKGASSTGGDLAWLKGYSNTSALLRWRRSGLPGNWRQRFPNSSTNLFAALPVADPNNLPAPAELVVIDPTPGAISLEVMS